MRNLKVIYVKELKSYFNSPMAYIFLVVFAVITGYFFTRTFFLFNQSDMRSLFNIIPLVYLFFIPALYLPDTWEWHLQVQDILLWGPLPAG